MPISHQSSRLEKVFIAILHINQCSNESFFVTGLMWISDSNKAIPLKIIQIDHCLKSVHILSYSGLHFPAFELNMERYGVSIKIKKKDKRNKGSNLNM